MQQFVYRGLYPENLVSRYFLHLTLFPGLFSYHNNRRSENIAILITLLFIVFVQPRLLFKMEFCSASRIIDKTNKFRVILFFLHLMQCFNY